MHQPRRLTDKLYSLDELKSALQELKKQGKKIVFTNGCFDIIHAGHVHLLQEARGLGDVLVVAVNSDSSVQTLKGPGRPVNHQQHRAQVVASLEAVDYVMVFDELDPLRVIRELKPGVLVKGGDWDAADIVGREAVEESGGEVRIIPLIKGTSTTDIITSIIKSYGNPR